MCPFMPELATGATLGVLEVADGGGLVEVGAVGVAWVLVAGALELGLGAGLGVLKVGLEVEAECLVCAVRNMMMPVDNKATVKIIMAIISVVPR